MLFPLMFSDYSCRDILFSRVFVHAWFCPGPREMTFPINVCISYPTVSLHITHKCLWWSGCFGNSTSVSMALVTKSSVQRIWDRTLLHTCQPCTAERFEGAGHHPTAVWTGFQPSEEDTDGASDHSFARLASFPDKPSLAMMLGSRPPGQHQPGFHFERSLALLTVSLPHFFLRLLAIFKLIMIFLFITLHGPHNLVYV